MEKFRSNRVSKRRTAGFFPLHDSISEEHVLQTLTHDDEVGRRSPFTSTRPRSHSVQMGRRRSEGPLQSSWQDPPDSPDFTNMVSDYGSLPRPFTRSNRRTGRLNTQLLIAVKSSDSLEVQRLLDAGASANATCHAESITACHIAALFDNNILSILLKHGAKKDRTDRLGRTPLHVAAWSGHVKHVVVLLEFPEDLQKKVGNGEMGSEVEEEIKEILTSQNLKDVVDVRCNLGNLSMAVPMSWRDDNDHCCEEICLPFLQPGWTPLHAAASSARHLCCRVLLAAGAEPCIRDMVGRTPLDVAGSACLYGLQSQQPLGSTLINFGFTEVIKMLLSKSCKKGSFKKNLTLDTPLHTAVELESLDAIKLLLKSGASPRDLNRAGLTPLHLCVKKRLKKHLQAFIYCDHNEDQERAPGLVDAKNNEGYTVLHYAILNNWTAGVCLALEARANIVVLANDGETPLHSAAALGNVDILREILCCARLMNVIDILNRNGQSPLFKAISNGHTDCVRMLLKAGASIKITLPRQYNVFHIATQLGRLDLLKVLLDHDYTFTREKVNVVSNDDRKGYGPIHFAIENNNIECVKLLLSKNAFVSLKTAGGLHRGSTPLHIAARKNNLEIAKIIIKFDASTIHNVDTLGWTPLHIAGYYASRDVIRLLILEGANLAACTIGPHNYQRTAIHVIITSLSKPTEFLESIFDIYINTHRHSNTELCLQDPDTEVNVDYSILVPNNAKSPAEKLTVIEALLKTGNRRGQRRLLIHPLVESFLCLKWKALLPFFYAMLFLYGLFVMTLTIFIMSEYFYKDIKTEDKPSILNSTLWMYALYASIVVVLLQEIIYMSASVKLYLRQLETWVKLMSILLALILPRVIQDNPSPPKDAPDWPRHIATMAVLLCWVDMTFLLSRFPNWGYYVLMFGKVSSNVVKILLTFAFLVIGFALSFMIQFHHQKPFESPWAALVKTMVMMTSEFDYDDLVDKKDPENIMQSLAIIRLVFLVFLILAAIVLMNLMVGVAVQDLHNLELKGHIMRLEKQVEFLASLETLVLNKVFIKLLPAKWKYHLELSNGLTNIKLKPCEPSWSYFKAAIPAHVRDAIFEKANALKKNEESRAGYETLRKQLCEIHKTVTKDEEASKRASLNAHEIIHKIVPSRLTDTDMIVVRMKKEMDEMNAKLDMMLQLVINQNLRE